ncbi:MAG: amino acid permease, partial [Gammaproteobacteria bacterium]|nr:amino acid permease [Gammaproteobacteria bacterium]
MAVIMANMIGTGVFTSLGFQLADIQSGFVLIMLWVVGGLTALCGALTYAELGAALPRSGGEYNFLNEIYHPAAGFISGWISATIGFAAPTALAGITFGTYLASVFPSLSPTWLACGLVLALTAAHASTRRSSGGVQRVLTVIKVLLILGFCVLSWILVDVPQKVSFLPSAADGPLLASGAFAVSLIYVNYAYTGWNAATYITGELERPQENLSRILLVGTGVVVLLYVLLNFTFLYVAPMDAMVGKLEIGYVSAQYAFGASGAAIMGVVLALLLISTVSAMILAGPRVLQVIGQDFIAFRWLAKQNADGVPAVAIAVQSILTLGFILSASFESILVFAGFTLGLNTFFTVLGVFVLRWRRPDLPRPYRTVWYPLPPLVFLSVTGWTLTYILMERPVEGLWGLAIVGSGGVFYLISR